MKPNAFLVAPFLSKKSLIGLGVISTALLMQACSSPTDTSGSCTAPSTSVFEGAPATESTTSRFSDAQAVSLVVSRSGRIAMPYTASGINEIAVLEGGHWTTESVGATNAGITSGYTRFFAGADRFYFAWLGLKYTESTYTIHLSSETPSKTFGAPIEIALPTGTSYLSATGSFKGSAADGSLDRVVMVTQGISAYPSVGWVEKVGSGPWLGELVTVPGLPSGSLSVSGAGYAGDGTAWMVFNSSNGIWISRRSAGAWGTATQLVGVSGASEITYVTVANTKEGAAPMTAVAWLVHSSVSGTTQELHSLVLDQTTQVIPTSAFDLGSVKAFSTYGDTSLSAYWDASGEKLIVSTYSLLSHQSSLIGYESANFSPALKPFDPAEVQAAMPAVFFDSCGNPYSLTWSSATTSTPVTTRVQALTSAQY